MKKCWRLKKTNINNAFDGFLNKMEAAEGRISELEKQREQKLKKNKPEYPRPEGQRLQKE